MLRRQKILYIAQDIIITVIGAISWIVVVIPFIIIPILLPFTLFRLFVHFLAKIFRPDLIPVTKTIENMMILKSSKKSQVMNCIQVWKMQGKLDADKFRQEFFKQFLSTEEKQEKYLNLYCYYVQWMFYIFKKPVDNLNLEEMIKEYRLRGDEEEHLDKFIANWASVSDYEKGKPDWKILICHKAIGGHNDNDEEEMFETILLSKIDHGLCDGYTFVHMCEKITGRESPYLVKDVMPPSFGQKVLHFKNMLSYPCVYALYGMCFGFTKELDFSEDEKKSEKWLMSFTSLDLNTLKKIRRATESHFNTVVGMLQVGAMRRHLIDTGRVTLEDELPKYTYIMSPVGVPGHPIMTGGGMTNHFTDILWKVPIKTGGFPAVQQLLTAEENFSCWQRKRLPEVYAWQYAMLWPFPARLNKFPKTFNKFNLFPLSNFLSPIILAGGEPYKLLGLKVDNIYISVHMPTLLPSIKVYVGAVSNAEKLDLSVLCSSEVFKSQAEVDKFTQVFMKMELDELLSSSNDLALKSHVNLAFEP